VCDGTSIKYIGSVWHDPEVKMPSRNTEVYTCVNNGCPDEGATEMKCKEGFVGPLCALCAPGYFQHMRLCNKCAAPRYGYLVLFVMMVVLLALLVVRSAYRARHYLARMNFFAHFKIIVSFVTLISTMEHQFGVKWPAQFAAALELLSILSFDLRFISALFCIVNINFWSELMSTTLTLAGVVALVALGYKMAANPGMRFSCIPEQDKAILKARCTFFAVYFLTFSYPLVSVKVVATFSCHNVNGHDYLRADYSLGCYDPRWRMYACYSTLFLCMYVFGFPVFVLSKLWRYRSEDRRAPSALQGKDRRNTESRKQQGKRGRSNKDRALGFLCDDYKSESWACLWEFEEMVRKLSLSVLGAFWSKKSSMCIATALVIAVFFQLLHAACRPYESDACTRLQHVCLAIIAIFYFSGLLLKVEVVTAAEEQYLGWLLCALLALVFVLAAVAVLSELYAVYLAYRMQRMAQQAIDDNVAKFDPSLQDHIIAYEDLELLEVLGEGAEGVVRKGKYKEALVAIKVQHISTVADLGGTEDVGEIRQAMEEAQAEAKVMKQLKHPNIVLFYGISLHANSLGLSVLLVIDLCNRSLSDEIYGNTLEEMSWMKKTRYALDVAIGMHYLHKMGVIHRGEHTHTAPRTAPAHRTHT
jgi:hypothetical protein